MIPTQGETDRTLHDKGEKIVVKGFITIESTYGKVEVKRGIHPYTLPIDIAIIDAIEKLVVKMLEENKRQPEAKATKEILDKIKVIDV